jgi:hypothetical protein
LKCVLTGYDIREVWREVRDNFISSTLSWLGGVSPLSTTPTNQPQTPSLKEPEDARLLMQHFPNANNLVFDKTKKGYVLLPILIRKAMK